MACARHAAGRGDTDCVGQSRYTPEQKRCHAARLLPSPALQQRLAAHTLPEAATLTKQALTCIEADQVIVDHGLHCLHVLNLVILGGLGARDHEVTPQQAAQLVGPHHAQPAEEGGG